LSWRYSPEPRRILPNWPDRESIKPVIFIAAENGLRYKGKGHCRMSMPPDV
jgi:hypothetical protein